MPSAALLKWALAGALTGGLIIAIGAAYTMGRRDGAANADLAAKSALVEQLNERGEIDGVVEKLPAPELCAALGGVWRNDRCE